MDRCRLILCLFLTLLLARPVLADERAEKAAELEALRERIGALQDELRETGRRRTRAEKKLREIEQAEQSARRELQSIRAKSKQAKQREADLREAERAQQAAIDAQRQALAKQVRTAYMTGNSEWLQMVLSQEDPAQLGRRMTYYGYFSRQRKAAIGLLQDALTDLAATRIEIQNELSRLQRLESDAADQLEEIANTRADRAAVVARMQKSMADRDAEIAGLREQEEELGKLVAALARKLPAMPDFDAEPFAGQTAQLSWPAKGPLLRSFGQSRADGSLKWNGVLLGAAAGSEVRAVYHGRVVFSDWLAGMGLLTIVEHDNGYMSLYGHNQDLLKDVGEWVEPGEVIAHVGDSGGQANAGLYFEIRKNGEPVDPRKWVK
ncbi:MAG: peptidoglycan DD-metalloendopeptidase family protein [Gammaproteobacteria bacterium]|nr:peptidoglycan DD-metalloendopeptidase family protein [Gammaproteobacteria bacterium]NND55543.1 peptidoglycan DD-metalloendopeptidase family protein [Gammaproteobacteria bacterium]